MELKQLIRSSLLGDQIAENDLFNIRDNFIETAAYRNILETKDASVVIGRRGTGKSAIFLKLQEIWKSQKHSIVAISPEEQQTLYFRSTFKYFGESYSMSRAAARLILKYGFYLEAILILARDYKIKDITASDTIINQHIKTWNAMKESSFFSKLGKKTLEIKSQYNDPSLALGCLAEDLNLSYLESFITKNIYQKRGNIFILLDKLDEGYENDDMGASIVSGIILAAVDINKKIDRVRVIIFQRDNIIRSVEKYDDDYTRNIEGELIRIHWDFYQLFNLITKRLNSCFNLEIENSRKTWDKCVTDSGFGRELKGEDGFKKCLQFTLYRPRDIISLLNKAYYEAFAKNRKVLIMDDIDLAAKAISKARLDDLQKEYNTIFPAIKASIKVFMGGGTKMSFDQAQLFINTYFDHASSQLTSKEVIDFQLLQSCGVIRTLYSIGFLGIYDHQNAIFTFCHDGRNPDREFTQHDSLLIHPCYWIALNLSKNALSPDDAEQINDEYEEINVTSIAPQLRQQRIGQLCAELGIINDGREHSSDFEKWCLECLKLIFSTHLNNFVLHPNGDATQRRDIIATNIEGSSVWKRIRNDYGARQVIFEIKNYKDLKLDDYRQMTTYLAKQYGNLGFIISKSESQEPRKGAELDWCKEMYQQHGKLIIKLNGKFLAKLLSKLRNPEKYDVIDKQISILIDNYERNYLANRPTR